MTLLARCTGWRGRTLRVAACALASSVAMVLGTAPVAAAAPPGLPASPGPAGTAGPPRVSDATLAAAKIRPELRAALDSAEATDFWVRFAERADLSAASRNPDWVERGTEVAAALREVAATSQAAVRDRLDAAGVDYEAFWATNAIHVRHGSPALAAELAVRPEVQALYPAVHYEIPESTPGEVRAQVNAVEWGIANINADDVWSQYGVTGAGVTVANIDSGVQFDHPALVRQYRGNRGDGTFDHNYNWFDAAGSCPDAPCDPNGHGTHTMGTMAGDDGGDNHVGVAPGVRWIAANGCCPDDAALIASGQWMLEPTDLTGEHPDAGRRPNVVNNSWGTRVPSNDPFMEDISAAWAASGIFATWSNGNNAPGCTTSGSPGSRIINYSAGAYDVNNVVARFSSRGAGQDGETKPNISAPGVDVRSSVPGDGYASVDGTSMAAPHVAGAVALLWSAAPDLVGDVDATRALLDGSATDSPDGQCGGTPADNNVYGEGRLDALRLVDSAHVGQTGTLTTAVVDRRTRRPVGGARITVTGPVERERVTGADGTYTLPLPPGDYTVRAEAFGYADQAVTVTVRADQSVTRRVAMAALPRVTVSGRVSDGSGQGWPLYAKITVDGVPGGTLHTRPDDGRYRVDLPAGATYTLRVHTRYGGYQTVTSQVSAGRHDVTHDVRVPVEEDTCAAAGYQVAFDGAGTTFDSGAQDSGGAPDGWSVVDGLGTGQVWRLDDPRSRGNRTGGTGRFAIVDSFFYGSGGRQDTSLVSPVADLSDQDAPVVGFRHDYDDHARDTATVELSLDGGQSWQVVLTLAERVRGPREERVAIPQAAHQSRVRVRFHYVGSFDDYWQVDDVFVGARRCAPVTGGVVLGHVRDRNTGAAVNHATVTGDGDPAVSATSAATPDDPGLGDGFYRMFVPGTGGHRFEATADGYRVDTEGVRVDGGRVSRRDFRLPAGELSVRPTAVSASPRLGEDDRGRFTVTNTGSAPLTVEFRERRAGPTTPAAGRSGQSGSAGSAGSVGSVGPVGPVGPVVQGVGAAVVRVPGQFSPLAFGRAGRTALGLPGHDGAGRGGPDQPDRPAEAPWTVLPAYPTRIMDNAVGELDGRIYSVGGVDGIDVTAAGHAYDPARGTWTAIADLPEARENAAGMFVGDRFYVVGGWGPDLRATRTTFVYDPATDRWAPAADAPVSAAASGRAVLDGRLYVVGGCTNACDGTEVQRYDPATDTWRLLAPYPHPAGHLACAGIGGALYCAGGVRRGGTVWSDTYAYDPAADEWTPRASMPVALWGMGYTAAYDRLLVSGGSTGDAITNEGFSYDPDTDRWQRLPASNTVAYRGGSACGLARVGGSVTVGFTPVSDAELLPTYGDCVPADVPWLSLDRTGPVTLAPGHSLTVTVRTAGEVDSPGTYTSGVWIKEDTPYLVGPVDVTMTVRAPRHGHGGGHGAGHSAGHGDGLGGGATPALA